MSCVNSSYSNIHSFLVLALDDDIVEIVSTSTSETNEPPKPHLLWACFFTLPDLSDVKLSVPALASLFSPASLPEVTPEVDSPAPILFVPGQDCTLVMDSVVDLVRVVAMTIYYDEKAITNPIKDWLCSMGMRYYLPLVCQ